MVLWLIISNILREKGLLWWAWACWAWQLACGGAFRARPRTARDTSPRCGGAAGRYRFRQAPCRTAKAGFAPWRRHHRVRHEGSWRERAPFRLRQCGVAVDGAERPPHRRRVGRRPSSWPLGASATARPLSKCRICAVVWSSAETTSVDRQHRG